MRYETIALEVSQGIATITLNRPDAYNALSLALARELFQAAIAVDEDPEVRCVVLTGAGKAFCGGATVYDVLMRGARTMPPIVVPPLIAAAALGAVVVGRWAVREYRRVNAKLDEFKGVLTPADRSHLPTLRQDPVSGVYRPQ